MKKLTLLLSILFVYGSLIAQSPLIVLNEFLASDLMQEYKELKNRAENSVKEFKILAMREGYTEEEIDIVARAYDISAREFNEIVVTIAQDLLDKSTRRYMFEYPQSYMKQVKADFYDAKELYGRTYQQEVSDLTGGQINGVPVMTLLPDIIKYTTLVVKIIRKIKAEVRQYNEQVLQQYLITPYQFQIWDDIE